MKIRGAKAWSGSSPQMTLPKLTHRLLGRMKMASTRLQVIENAKDTDQ